MFDNFEIIQGSQLLSRNKFRENVFKRDDYKCVICKAPAIDAHHIIERRLFDNSGYYIDNGASVCEQHHIEAEETTLSTEALRVAAEITTIILPEHFYVDEQYDKWGNIICKDGTRLPGELFYDESVQKILKQGNVLHLFKKYIKHPRTMHLPWSKSVSDDDKMIKTLTAFYNKRVVATIKMDGEQATIYNDYYHARSLENSYHQSRTWIKNLQARIGYLIPDGWRICGENLWAKHSIHYTNLYDYFYVHSIWNEKNECLQIDEMLEWCELLELTTPDIVYDEMFDIDKLKALETKLDFNRQEGYVLRIADSFSYRDFRNCVAKFVRPNHVSTQAHWMQQAIIKNELLKE